MTETTNSSLGCTPDTRKPCHYDSTAKIECTNCIGRMNEVVELFMEGQDEEAIKHLFKLVPSLDDKDMLELQAKHPFLSNPVHLQ